MLPMNLTMDMATEMTAAAIFKMFSNNFSLPIYSSFPPACLYGAIGRIYQYGLCIYDTGIHSWNYFYWSRYRYYSFMISHATIIALRFFDPINFSQHGYTVHKFLLFRNIIHDNTHLFIVQISPVFKAI